MTLRTSDFDYDLPEELIAQEPLSERDASRMLVLNRSTRIWQDSTFREFTEQLRADDLVIVNNSRVIPARLIGRRKESGGRVEIFLVREISADIWQVLIRPSARLRVGAKVVFGDGQLEAELIDEPGAELRKARFVCDEPFESALGQIGLTPLPPYIKRPEGVSLTDNERYQTIYSKARGAIAAPTAGLHFTNEQLSWLRKRNQLVEITLHVGYGTFEPVRVDDVNEHEVSSERFEITFDAAQRINQTREQGGRIVAVGTTTTRALESASSDSGQVQPGSSEATLTIKPGYRFRVVDALLTNFHLPQSSLLILLCSFAGRDLVLQAYKHAVEIQYRFYSYGDCMLVL
ncbi:MAG TPA: tRNA preQ1(34) S-adenosylmethionine ribosyltransferase-isomerase QueA [Pyrinomonadaceae bacterium]|nr:tRNA preQ1(34) S-adenosylmethionine ribosyltransferase-isomerase QueA [Pyrinomonadaceae bacterium]